MQIFSLMIFSTCLKFTEWSVRSLFSRYWNKTSDRFTERLRFLIRPNTFFVGAMGM